MDTQNHAKPSDDKNHNDLTYILNDFKSNIGNNIHFIGQRQISKDILIRDILTKMIQSNNIESVTIFTYLNSTNNYSYLNNSTTCNTYKYDKEILKEIIDKQKINSQNSDILKPILVIMDDCICENECNTDNNIRELLLNGRHYNIHFIVISQYPIRFSPALRCNFDYVLYLKNNAISNMKRVYEYYYGVIPSFKMFHDIIINMNDNECIIVDTQSGLNNVVGYYKPSFING